MRENLPRLAAVVAGITVGVAVLIAAFAWPAANIAPREVPVAVAGPAQFVTEVTQKLDHMQPGGFTVSAYSDAETARQAIRDRDAYGAIVAGRPPAVLSAPAASPAVAQILDGIAAGIAAPGGQAHATPVVPLPADDPRGAGFAAGSLPLVLGALLGGILSFVAFRTVGLRLVALAGAAVCAGLSAAALLGPWLGVLTGGYPATAGVIALGLFAGGGVVVGAASLLGPLGIGLGAVTIMVLGNPLSGATSAPELLPSGWGAFGQWLPPGALTTLLRSVSFFDGAAAAAPAAVLLGWTAFGLALAAAAHLRGRSARQN
ncbi:MAG: hypothetical protein HOQ24_03410 [Mycobacteriaceae bacterium]|nr:hypothetical protein [Mycobacteriaceae bacterium]